MPIWWGPNPIKILVWEQVWKYHATWVVVIGDNIVRLVHRHKHVHRVWFQELSSVCSCLCIAGCWFTSQSLCTSLCRIVGDAWHRQKVKQYPKQTPLCVINHVCVFVMSLDSVLVVSPPLWSKINQAAKVTVICKTAPHHKGQVLREAMRSCSKAARGPHTSLPTRK